MLRLLQYSHFLHTCLAFGVGLFCCVPLIAAHISSYPYSPLHTVGNVFSFPVYHRSSSAESPKHYLDVYRQRTRRILDLAVAPAPAPASDSPGLVPAVFSPPPPPSSHSNVPELRSNLVTLSEPFGQYFAELQIGTPAKPVAVIIDTGSQLLWIQCTPCIQCGAQVNAYPIFDPAKSSSYLKVMCTADACSDESGSIAMGCTDAEACEYTISYGDKSNSSGILSAETLTFTTATPTSKGATSFQLLKFVFGCGVDNEGVETRFNASGLMGLDRGPYSVVSQLNVDVFSYCLPNRENTVDISGYLTFSRSDGNSSTTSSSKPSLQYTPMLQNTYSSFLSQFYYIGLTGVSINGKLLDIPAAAFELDTKTGTGGTVIDSGTTLTTFVDEAYAIIIAAFNSYVDASLKRVELDANSTTLCYEVPLTKQKGAPEAPKVTLHFTGPADMELSTEQLFHLYGSDTTSNYYCLAMASGGSLASGGKNFVGNFQQQNFLVEYDIGNSRVGFAPTECSPTKSAASSVLTTAAGRPLWYLTATFVCMLFVL